MTAIDTSTLDLGQLAVVVEGFTPPNDTVSVDVTSIDELGPVPGAAGWTMTHDGGVVVLAPIGGPAPDFVAGLLEHVATQLGLAVVEVSASDVPPPVAASAVGVRGEAGTGVALYLTQPNAVSPGPDAGASGGLITLGMLREVPLEVSAELGRTRMPVSEILQLNVGSVVELDRTAGSPVDVVVNGSLIARGEVVVIDDEYGVRITEILGRVSDSL